MHVALLNDENSLRGVAERFCQYLLEEEMNNHLEAFPYQRTEKRRGYRNG
ncbi:MAG: transposase [Candidatus Aerophobetes bacterium]|nr:transposase [Candidatus Aerophobetes bacterium]